MLTENDSEYNLSEKIYNALFYSVLEYIHQLNMLSHVKYRNYNFTESKKSKYCLGTSMLKQNCSEYNLSEKNIQCTILLGFGVYTPTQYALKCKIPKF